jgi:hypothetical protein
VLLAKFAADHTRALLAKKVLSQWMRRGDGAA